MAQLIVATTSCTPNETAAIHIIDIYLQLCGVHMVVDVFRLDINIFA